MTVISSSRLIAACQHFARMAALAAILTGCLVLAGWIFDIGVLKSVLPGLVTMKANTAVCFLLAGAALWLRRADSNDQRSRMGALAAQGCALTVLVIGVLTVNQDIWGVNFGIDQLLFQDLDAVQTAHPGRMSPATALNWLLIGSALLFLNVETSRGYRLVQFLVISALLISFLDLVGYLYNFHSLYKIGPYSSMAVHTAAMFILVCAAVLAMRPDRGLMTILTSDHIGGFLARRLLPAVIILPVLVGWVRLQGQRAGLYDTEFGLTFFVFTSIILFVILIMVMTKSVDQTDVDRKQVEEELKQLTETLEQRVAERTNELVALQTAAFNMMEDAEEARGKAERAEVASAKLAAIVASSTDAIVSADSHGNIVSWNKGARTTFDYEEAEMLGKPLTTLMPERYREAHLNGLARMRGGGGSRVIGKTVQLEGLRKDGSEFPLELVLSTWKASEGIFYSGIIRDITERKRAEEALHASEERIRLLVDSVKDYEILMLDSSGHVVSWNAGAERIKGYRADEIVGQHFSRFYTDEDIASGKPEKELQVAAEQGAFEDTGWRVRKDGSRFWANMILTAIRDQAGALRGFSKVTRDITERRRAEEEIRLRTDQLEAANRELEAFSYSVSHDLRAPLRHVNGFTDLLVKHAASTLDDKGRRYLKTISESVKQMGLLIDDLLSFSRMGRTQLHFTEVNLEQLVKQVMDELKPDTDERRIAWTIGALPEVSGDRAMLRQVLINLLGNAVKYTRPREKAKIEIGILPPALSPGGRGDGEVEIVIFVRDNGVGFDMQYAHKLFGVFQRLHSATEFEGTGIGLALVQRIIHRHGGRIWAEGAVNKGATFSFSLPAQASGGEKAMATSESGRRENG